MGQNLSHMFINPGFLSMKPLAMTSFLRYWFLNLGVSAILAIIGFLISDYKQKKIYLCFFLLFILGNIFQVSFRIEHNHSLFNFFIIFSNLYVAFALTKILKYKQIGILLFIVLFFFLTFSGFLDIMAVKNDFQYPFYDAPRNKLMQWVKDNTQGNDIFLSKEEILDPITLAGRKNYFGHRYYLEVMGYDFLNRKNLTKNFFEARSIKEFAQMRKEKITYIVLPAQKTVDFNYNIDIDFFKRNLKQVYTDQDVLVFKL